LFAASTSVFKASFIAEYDLLTANGLVFIIC
jgi:hypothetical protein